MPPISSRRLAAAIVVALALTSACGGPEEVRTVADFDEAPCVLFTDELMQQIVAEPYGNLAGVEPKLTKAEKGTVNDDTFGCVYTFQADGEPQVPQVRDLTVTVAHNRNGSQHLAICVAGAMQKVGGYRIQKVGDQSCLTPASDMWMKVGENYFQIIVVPRPGFDNEVDAGLALAPLILAVAEGTASRMPKS